MYKILLSTAAVCLVLPATAFAQVSNEAAAVPAPTDGLGDIVVTAQRRVENSQRAAIPLAVIDGAALTSAGVTQASRLNELAPALSIEPSSTGNLIFLRGVGNFTVTAASDPAVAFNYDGVYVGRPTSTTGVFYDLERVEILKGPQGILYGRNATGGAINVLPRQPKLGEFSGYAAVAYGNYNTINAEGAINVPMGDHGALRISATTSNHDGYLRDGTQDEKTLALRVQMKAELTPNLTVRVAGDYARNSDIGSSVSYYGSYSRNPAVPLSATPVPGSSYFNFVPANLSSSEGVYSPASQAYRQSATFGPTGRKLDALAPYPFQKNNFYGVNAEIAWNTGAGTLTVIPAWRYAALDYLSSAGAFPYRDVESNEQFSLEARFAGERISIFDYTVGAYYYDERIEADTQLSNSNIGILLKPNYYTKSYAGFGRLIANVTDQLRLVGGLRYTVDDKQFVYSATTAVIQCLAVNAFGAPNCPTAPLIGLPTTTSAFPFPFPAAGGRPIPVFTSPGPPNYLIIRADSAFVRAKSSNRLTYKAAVEFDILPRSLLYASFETGYRSGGFSAAAGFENFEPEYITAYTIGMKNRFLDNRIQLNLEAFLWDYKNQQINHVGLDINGRSANYTQNAGSSRIQGVEVDGRFLITPTTLVSADVQYLDAKQRSFSYLAGPGNPPLTGCAVTYTAANPSPYLINCAGFQSYNSPKWTINLAAQQTFVLGDFQIVAGADTQYKGARNIGFAYLPEQRLRSNWTTNAQLRVGPTDERWALSAYVRNIEDKRIPIYSSTHPTASFLVAGTTAPRTYGVQASVKF
ncbi:TonB-dependent receptor [Sphingomonas sp.]|uniref:TonB-dependent receptor n=1 Tax=Sphingomonas sp. TaxID=28214 RepID=UPI0025E817D2|nr:TonB-dependent receptor [Sphingomonas sp.]